MKRPVLIAVLLTGLAVLLWILLMRGRIGADAAGGVEEWAPVGATFAGTGSDVASELQRQPSIQVERVEAGSPQPVHITGVTVVDNTPRAGVLIEVGGLEYASGINGEFSFAIAELPMTARFSFSGCTAREIPLSEDRMRVALHSLLNLAIEVLAEPDVTEAWTGSWTLVRNPTALAIRPGVELPEATLVASGTFESGRIVLLPEQEGSAWHERAYEVICEANGETARGWFGERFRKFPQDPDREYRVCTILQRRFQPPQRARIRFLDLAGASLAERTVFVPTSHAIPRSWRQTTTDAEGAIEVERGDPSIVPHCVIAIGNGSLAAGLYGRVNERSPSDFEVHVPVSMPSLETSGELPEGGWLEYRRTALFTRNGSEETSDPVHHEFSGDWMRPEDASGSDLVGMLGLRGRLEPRLMPDRLLLPSIDFGCDDAAIPVELPELHAVSVSLHGNSSTLGRLRLATRMSTGIRSGKSIDAAEWPVDLQLPAGRHDLTLFLAGTSTELGSATCLVPEQRAVELVLEEPLRLLVRLGADPCVGCTVLYQAKSGQSVQARVGSDGFASLYGIDLQHPQLNLLPATSEPRVLGVGSSALMLGYAVDALAVQSGEAVLDVPHGFLRLRNDAAASIQVAVMRRALPSGRCVIQCPSGATGEYSLPIGRYAIERGELREEFEMTAGRLFEHVID
jgi:hypothetical protein